jgi:hypothetical protein
VRYVDLLADWRSALAPVQQQLDLDVNTDLLGQQLTSLFNQRLLQLFGAERSGVWRYRELVVPTMRDAEIVSWPEGNTPLLDAEGMLLKHEGMNPTGSFKDRGMTVAISQAKRIGARGGLRLNRKHVGVTRGLWGAGGIAGGRARPRRQDRGG